MDDQQDYIWVNELFGYWQKDALDVIVMVTLVATWLGIIIVYNPVEEYTLSKWIPTAGVVFLGGLATMALNRRRYRLAVGVWIVVLVLALALAIGLVRDGQLLYVGAPIISIAGYLAGPQLALLALAGMAVSAVAAGATGIPASEMMGAIALAALTFFTTYASSRHLYTALKWAWANYELAREHMQQAQQHRADLARMAKSLDEAHERLKRLNDAFVTAWQEAESAKRFKEQLVANVSHELRTPLYIIIGFSETMLFAPESYRSTLPPQYRSDLAEIHRNSQHLLKLIDDVLDLAQMEMGRVGLLLTLVDPKQIIHEAVEMIEPLAQRKSLVLQVHMDDALPSVMADHTRIRQVLLNLLNNAIRHTEHGSVTVDAVAEPGQLVISVTDTGSGIPPSEQARIFEGFYRVRAAGGDAGAGSGENKGFGLGLTICRALIEMHGGRIWVESTLGQGSRFSLSLPVASQFADEPHFRSPFELTNAPVTLIPQARDVLVVSPDPGGARALERHVSGYRFIAANDAAAAQEYLRQAWPKAVITNEDTVTALLRTGDQAWSSGLLRVPVITCPMVNSSQQPLAPCVKRRLTKPVMMDAFLDAIEECVQGAHNILVADDDAAEVRLLGRMLLSTGRYEVRSAYGGAEALAYMRDQPPDLLVLDLYLPDMDGFTVVNLMAADPALERVPVIIVSGRDPMAETASRRNEPITLTCAGGLTAGDQLHYLQALLDAASGRSVLNQSSDRVSAVDRTG